MLPIPLPRSLVPALVAAAFLFPGAPASAQSNAATPVPAHHATTFRVLAFSTVDSAAVALAVPVQRTLERAIADDRTWMLVQPDSPQRADIIVSGSIRLVAQDSTSVTWRAIRVENGTVLPVRTLTFGTRDSVAIGRLLQGPVAAWRVSLQER